MSNEIYNRVAYGLSQPLINVFPTPIVSKRTPTTADKKQLGTLWILPSTNAAYVITSITNNLANWENISGGAGSFTNLVVSGTSTLTGAVTAGSTLGVTGLLTASGGTTSAGLTISSDSNINVLNGTYNSTIGGIITGTVSGGTIQASTGNLIALAGGVVVGGGATPTASAGQVAYGSNPSLANAGSGTFVITGTSGAGNTKNSGFLQVNIAGTNYYIPVFPATT